MPFTKSNLKDKRVAFDTETTGLNPWGDFKRWGFYPARPFAFSFSDLDGNTKFIRWNVEPKTREVLVNKKDLSFIQDILEDERIDKIGHNIGFDIRMAEMIGIKTKGRVYDTLVMMHIITGGAERSYALKTICEKFLDFKADDENVLLEDTKRQRAKVRKLGYCLARVETHGKEYIKSDYWLANPKVLEAYAVNDAIRASMLFQVAKTDIEEDPKLFNIFQTEMKLFWVVKEMEDRGVRVFPEEIKNLEKFYTDYMAKQRTIADQNGGKGINFNSPQQKVKKFITERGHKPLKLTEKSKQPSIDGDFLLAISDKDPLAKAILEYTAAEKGISTFLKPYKKFMVKQGDIWVIHPNYKNVGPVTGRMACSDPNLMQVGSEDSAKKKADIALYPRKCFGPRPGHVWYMPDYSQEEVWLAMFHANDENGKKYLLSGKSFHGQLNKSIWESEPDYETNKSGYRKRTKIIVFTKFYGGGKKKIALELDCTEEQAWEFMQKINNQIPGVDDFMRSKTREARENGFIRTSFGRKCVVDPELCYKGMNYDIQGTAADIMKRAMVRLNKYFKEEWNGEIHLILTLHDELGIEVPLKFHSKKLMRSIIKKMQVDSNKAGIPVPLPISMKIIKSNWSKEIKLCDKHLNPKCEPCNEEEKRNSL